MSKLKNNLLDFIHHRLQLMETLAEQAPNDPVLYQALAVMCRDTAEHLDMLLHEENKKQKLCSPTN